jgi:hypothetical protein
MGFGGCKTDVKNVIMAKNPFLNFPPEFYKNLFAASALYTHHKTSSSSSPRQTNHHLDSNKVINFPRNLLYSSSRDDNEVQQILN